MIRVECPHCHKVVKAPDKYAGKTVNCPGCSGVMSISVKAVGVVVAPPELSAKVPPETFARVEPRIPCRYCGEQIIATARKCRYCGEFLENRGDVTAVGKYDFSSPVVTSDLPVTSSKSSCVKSDWLRNIPFVRIAITTVVLGVYLSALVSLNGGTLGILVGLFSLLVYAPIIFMVWYLGLFGRAFSFSKPAGWAAMFVVCAIAKLFSPLMLGVLAVWCTFRQNERTTAYSWTIGNQWVLFTVCLFGLFGALGLEEMVQEVNRQEIGSDINL